MRKLLQITAEYAIRYLEGLDTRQVAPTQEARANLIQFDEPLPNQPVEPELVLQLLDRVGVCSRCLCLTSGNGNYCRVFTHRQRAAQSIRLYS